MKIPYHSVTILVGPTGCGKTTFANTLKDQGAVVLSSDFFRFLLSGYPENSNDPALQEVSAQAFQLLFAHLESVISYPVNEPHVVVDTTGLSENFRDQVRNLAAKHQYKVGCIVFDYKKRSDYISLASHREKSLVEYHIKTLREKTLPSLRRKDYDFIFRVNAPLENSESFELETKDKNSFTFENAFVIGDVHECVEELKALLEKKPVEATPILVGDYLDKGGATKETVDFIYDRKDLVLIEGNHESYVYKRLTNQLSPNPEVEEKYITSLAFLLHNEETATKFKEMFETRTIPFAILKAPNQSTVYVTHAPAEAKYLGKWDTISRRHQRNLRWNRDDKKFEYHSTPRNHPKQICGHISHSDTDKLFYNGIYYIDTGCVEGYSLTGLHYSSQGFQPVSVKSSKPLGEVHEFIAPASTKELVVEDPRDQRFLKRLPSTGVRFISATMAPARSTENDIESLEEAIRVFNGELVSVQPKYMGSRAQVYLHNDYALDFCVSRNGFVIKDRPGLREAMLEVREQVARKGIEWNELLIVDTELLPWHVLGEGLIEKEFYQYLAAVKWEMTNLGENLEDIAAFEKQLELYGKPGTPKFKPFGILSVDGVDWSEKATFNLVSDDEELIVNSYTPEVQKFFDNYVAHGLEGVVVKPLVWKEGLPPFLKVRNKEYLRLVYGFDYLNPQKYSKLCATKRVGRKLSLSTKEFLLGRKMLTAENEEQLVRAAFEMLGTLKQESTLDPRL